jgi:hypothetical protein
MLSGLGLSSSVYAASTSCEDGTSAKIQVTLTPRTSAQLPGRLLVDLRLRNEGTQTLRIGSWLIFSKCQVRSHGLRVRDDAYNTLAFRGRDIGYGSDEPEESLEPGESLTIAGLDITEHFDFPTTAKRLWIGLGAVAWIPGPHCVEVSSKEVSFHYKPTHARRSGRPTDGQVASRRQRERETVVTCASGRQVP